jgi:hypothetical protein
MPTVVIAPCNVAGFPEGGGHFWVYLQYALGLRQLGCEVYWLEAFRSKGRAEQEEAALAAFLARMKAWGFEDKTILYRTHSQEASPDLPTEYLVMDRQRAEAVYDRADLLLNFHYAISPALLSCFNRTALVDIDPGLLQFWISRNQISVPPHDCYFTIGEGIGRPGGKVPESRLQWTQIHPAVCLDCWPYVFEARSEAFTTVSIWDSSDWVVDHNETYENTKRVAFLPFAGLPRLTPQPLELALFLKTERDFEDRRFLEQQGWRIKLSREVAGTPEKYQGYIHGSRGEFSCAKPSYVKFQTGWVSDRTVCYLASGKPVVVQDTGVSEFLPNGEGMFRFNTADEATAAIAAINSDYRKHCHAARELAETFFDARRVVGKILSHAITPLPFLKGEERTAPRMVV